LRRCLQIAAVNQLLPACDAVPPMNRLRALIWAPPSGWEMIDRFALRRSPSERGSRRETGLLTYGWGVVRTAFPPIVRQWPYAPDSLPITVAGQWRILTAFPYISRAGSRISPETGGAR
jgi:hypothetical protein